MGRTGRPDAHFNPRTPCGVRPEAAQRLPTAWSISIHAPRAGCDVELFDVAGAKVGISIHAPRAGCDCARCRDGSPEAEFQSTHPVRGATALQHWRRRHQAISIHAPRAGCDVEVFRSAVALAMISIHAPRAGCDRVRRRAPSAQTVFQSTHPVRGATVCPVCHRNRRLAFQSTHPVRGATESLLPARSTVGISIHAPRAGCDTVHHCYPAGMYPISIHAPRAGCDCREPDRADRGRNFNPRTPCGVRRPRLFGRRKILLISIHAPRAGCDQIERAWSLCCAFQSTHPVRGATSDRGYAPIYARISIHAPRAGCDTVMEIATAIQQISIHAPRAGCDAQAVRDGKYKPIFQSTHPVRGAT